MSPSVIQPSFTGGEISPSLYARVDLARYGTSLRTCRNFLVQRHGGVVTRPGFRFIDTAASASVTSRLVEFVLGVGESALLEFGNLTIRVFRGGALQPLLTLVSPYTGAQVSSLQVAQVGAVMVVVHPDHAPRELTWTGSEFTLQAATFGPIPDLGPIDAPTLSVPTVGSNPKPHEYVVTGNLANGDETRASAPVSITCDLRADNPVTVTSAAQRNVYRGRNGVYGYIGSSTGTTFLDENIAPDYSSPPPAWNNPFNATGLYPSTVTHFQQRRWYGGSTSAPQTILASRASELRRFDAASPARDDDAIDVTLAATQGQGVRHFVPLNRLMVLTSRAEWSASAGNDAVLTPNSTGFQAESAFGCSAVAPVMTGDGAVYVQAQGTRVRDLVYNPQLQQFGGTDLTVLASHLFEGFEILDLAWTSYPHSCVWAVRSDGVLLALTYLRDQEVWGWSQHTTDGAFERVCSVREGQREVLYAIIRRTVGGVPVRHIEAITDRFPRDPLGYVCMDAALSYDGRNTDPARTVLLAGAAWTAGAPLTAAFSTAPAGASVGDEVVLSSAEGTRLCAARITAVMSATEFSVLPDRDVPVSLRAVATSRWALAQAVFTGLSHLVGREVVAVIDGNVSGAVVVGVGGTIALNNPGAVVHVGLPYTCTMETLDLAIAGSRTVRDRQKVVSRLTVYVEQSRGLFCGLPDGEMVEIKPQRDGEAYDAPVRLFTGTHEVRIPSTWNEPGRIVVEQHDPLPATVLAVIPEVTIGG